MQNNFIKKAAGILMLIPLCVSVGANAQTVTIGTGTSTSYLYGPYYRSSASSSFNYSRYAFIFTAAELGIPAGSIITQVEWYKATGTLTGNNTFNMWMKTSTATTLTSGSTWGSLQTGSTAVYASTTKSFTVTGGWEPIVLSTPFVYTGNSLVILTDHVKSGTASGSNNFQYTSASGKSIGYASSAAPTTSSTLTTTYGNNRPNIRITYTPGCTAPSVSSHPTSVAACPSSNLSFSVGTSIANPVYGWQMSTNGGTTWANVSNGGVYSGATSSILNITGATASMNAYKYRCFLSTACTTATATSNAATLSINTLPAITTHPASKTICATTNTTFTAAASGTGVGYQWQVNEGSGYSNIVNGGVYSGAIMPTLSITNANANMTGYKYRCVATGTCSPSVTTNEATLTINALPTVISDPTGIVTCPSGNASFSIAAAGAGVNYQWQVNSGGGFTNLTNNALYDGVVTATLNITGVSVGMNNYQYRCVVNGTCSPGDQSSPASLSVGASIPISASPRDTTVCVNTTARFNVTTGAAGVSYQWQQSAGAAFSNIANGGGFSGVTTRSLVIASAAMNMNNNRYRCVVYNSCVAPFTTADAKLSITPSPSITTQPVSVTTCNTSNVTFNVGGAGPGITYQWQVNSGSGFNNIASAPPYVGMFSNVLTIMTPSVNMNGYIYRCQISGTCAPPVLSNAVVLTVNGVPTITTQPVNSIICSGGNTSFTTAATGTGIAYRWQVSTPTGYVNVNNGGVYSGATTGTLNMVSVPAIMNGTDYRCVITGTCSPAAISNIVSLNVNTTATITSHPVNSVICEGGSTIFNVEATAQGSKTFQWQVSTGSGFANLVNGAPYSGVTTNNLTITNATAAINNYHYRCVITASCTPVVTSDSAKIIVDTLPKITLQPSDITVCPTTVATFSITATGTLLSYKWQVNSGSGYANIPGDNAVYNGSATNTLHITTAVNMNNYLYRCIVGGACNPKVTSTAKKLTVLNPLVINSHTIADTVCEGAMAKFGVSVGGQQSTNVKYQWQKKLSNGSYIDILNIPPYSGVTNDTLTFTSSPDTIGGGIYRCRLYETVSSCGMSYYTDDIMLSMNFSPSITPGKAVAGPGNSATFSVLSGATHYQWQENNHDGNGFVDLSESSPYAGVNTNTLVISPVNMLMNGNTYRCIVDGVCETPMITKASTLEVNESLNVAVKANDNVQVYIYPNPLTGSTMNIRFSNDIKGETSVNIVDRIGSNVYTGKINIVNDKASIDLASLMPGVYLLHIVNNDAHVVQSIRFTKQ